MEVRFSDKMNGLKPSVIREILKFASDPEVISFSAGNPAAEAFPVQAVETITADIFRKNPIDALQYSITEGFPPLRENIRKICLSGEPIVREEDDLIVVSGAQQGVELTCKVLCNPGDTVICENPSFIGSLNAFRANDIRLVGVDMEEDGIEIQKLEEALKENPNTRFLYLIPNFQNPSGITMSLAKRKAVLELASKYQVMIIEDNPYGDIRFAGEPVPSLKSMDTEGRVVYCGSFSKVLSPGLRVGYVAALKELIAKVVVCKQVEDVHTTILSQMICSRFLEDYDYARHLEQLKDIYRRKCGLMLRCLEEQMPQSVAFTKPEGGLFVWCTLPDGTDMMEFCRKAVEEYKVAVVPGTAFSADEAATSQSFRINFSTPSDEEIVRGVGILAALCREMGL